MVVFTLPAGKYYIGDPCYVIRDHIAWMAFLESCDFFEESHRAFFDKDEFWASETAYGDGVYNSNIGFRFTVDAGLIGIVPMSVVERYANQANTDFEQFGVIVTFDDPFIVRFNPRAGNDPTHVFGHIKIFTDSCNEDDY
jgi:hypothetical protein